MHLPHSLTVSDIRRPSVIYDFLSFNAMILLGILRGRLARNSTDEIYCNLHRESGCLSLSLSLSLTHTLEIVFNSVLFVCDLRFFFFSFSLHVSRIPCPFLYPTFHISHTSHSISHVVHFIFYISYPMFDILTFTFCYFYAIFYISHFTFHILRPSFHILCPIFYIPRPIIPILYFISLHFISYILYLTFYIPSYLYSILCP